MNKSEQLLSAFSETFFYKELVFDDLCFTPAESTEIELADLIINLDDFIIAIQLKSRNSSDQTDDIDKENKWLEKKCKNAKKQIKDTLKLISTGAIPPFKNKRGQSIILNSSATMVPLVVFENSKIESYPHLLKKHNDNGITVNCISFPDFQEMCKVLYTPTEIIAYLKYRKSLYEKYGEMNIMIFDGKDDELVITTPLHKETLVHQFLAECYGYKKSTANSFLIKPFQQFLNQLPEHTVLSTDHNGSYRTLLFLAHFDRMEITTFMKSLIETHKNAKKGVPQISKSIRRADGKYAILFVAGGILDMDYLAEKLNAVTKVNLIVEVAVYFENKTFFRIDFLVKNNAGD